MSTLAGWSWRRGVLCAWAIVSATAVAGCASAPRTDPLAQAIHERAVVLRDTSITDPLWREVAPGARSLVARAESALVRGDRELALEWLAQAWPDLEAVRFTMARPDSERQSLAAFEAEWRREAAELLPATPPTLDGVTPADVRAQGEAALPPVREYYEASADYARSTSPGAGVFYLGAAHAQRSFAELCRSLSERSSRRAPPVRPLRGELDALENALLAAYRPPASIELHPRFIEASSALKEARELDEAGFHHGALLRYLLAVQLASRVRGAPPSLSGDVLAARLREWRARLPATGVDHSIGRVFLERAEFDFAAAPRESAHVAASAIVEHVLPAYVAALEPAKPATARPPAAITVTLVRWPYT
jgi:hypothetical protein